MAILVTGGAGFIGSHLCDKLLTEGKEVVCLDNLDPYYSPARKLRNIQHNLGHKKYIFITLDVTKKEPLEKVFDKHKIEQIVHLAALAGVRPSLSDPMQNAEANILATINLLEMARKHKIKSFIFASSSSVYGNNRKVPFSEEDRVDFPASPYAASKKSAELYCYLYSKLFSIHATCLRFFTVYGPRGRPDMAPYLFVSRISQGKPITMFGDGRSKRDYTYVSDVIDGIVAALRKNFRFEIINLGNSAPIELSRFIEIVERKVGKKAKIKRLPPQLGDVPITFADISKAKRLLNYEPKVSLESGIAKLVQWYEDEKAKGGENL